MKVKQDDDGGGGDNVTDGDDDGINSVVKKTVWIFHRKRLKDL